MQDRSNASTNGAQLMSNARHTGQVCKNKQGILRCKKCKEAGKVRAWCKVCWGSQICCHGRQKRQCKDCGGSGLCMHGFVAYIACFSTHAPLLICDADNRRRKSRCKDCGGSGLCKHRRRKVGHHHHTQPQTISTAPPRSQPTLNVFSLRPGLVFSLHTSTPHIHTTSTPRVHSTHPLHPHIPGPLQVVRWHADLPPRATPNALQNMRRQRTVLAWPAKESLQILRHS